MGKAELFRQTEDHVPDSVLLDFATGCFSAIKYVVDNPINNSGVWCAYGRDEDEIASVGETIREAIKNAMGCWIRW